MPSNNTGSGRRYHHAGAFSGDVWIEMAGDEVEHSTSADTPAFMVKISIDDLRDIVRAADMRRRADPLDDLGRGAVRLRAHKVDAGYIVADGGGWLPGIYDTELTAWHACAVDIEELEKIAEAAARHERAITMTDLDERAGHADS